MRYRQHPNVVARTVAGEDILVPLNEPARRIFTLTRTGRALWDRLSSPATAKELADLLVTGFGAPPSQVDDDVAAFLGDMAEFRLVESLED